MEVTEKIKRPIIFAVDDDPQVLRAVVRDLKSKYRNEYRILSTSSANEALESLGELKKKQETVAMFLSDQRMPELSGVDFLTQARTAYPDARRVLLTAYSDIEAAIKAINDVQLDHYLTKPWDPPEEKFFPVLDDLLDIWQMEYVPDFTGIRVVGYQFSPKSHAVKDFLSGNLIPYQWLDIESNEKAKELTDLNEIDPKDLPAVFFEDGSCLTQPTPLQIAEKLGRNYKASNDLYDVTIIGAGPSGLAAAVYGSSEGLKTLLIERHAPGGQAGTSSRIENYLGFPKGLSGGELTRRAVTQATRLGAELLSPQEVVSIKANGQYKLITLADGSELNTKAIIISTGVNYRKLDVPGLDQFTGAGVYYGAANTEATSCREEDVYIVGGGNSAGQAAMYLSQFAKKVGIVIRGESLTASMSQYLIDQIEGTDNIELHSHSQITEAHGDERLRELTIKNNQENTEAKLNARALFIFIGARPYTDWLSDNILKDDKGFVITGRDLMLQPDYKKVWKLEREPFMLETCVPGIFASGDVRSGAMNRVASAVGEGSMSIKFTHEYLAEN